MIDVLVSVLYAWAKNVVPERMQNSVVGVGVGCFFYFIDTIRSSFFSQSKNACMVLNKYLIEIECIFPLSLVV